MVFYFWFLQKSFGLQADNQQTWKNHIDQMISNLCVAHSTVLHQQTVTIMVGMEPRNSLKRG
jgi:abortive infection bacteriophage resistance protein